MAAVGTGGDKALLERRVSAGESALQVQRRFERLTKLPPRRGRSAHGDGAVLELTWDDVEIGTFLDEGGFSSIYKVSLRTSAFDSSFPPHGKVLKCVKTSLLDENKDEKLTRAAVDLTFEAEFLSRLVHENIISLRAFNSGCVAEAFLHQPRGFFIILDYLEFTLKTQIETWQQERTRLSSTADISQQKKLPRLWSLIKPKPQSKRQQPRDPLQYPLLERIQRVAIGIARGIEYLHQNSIVHRDLKPLNIGFDLMGRVKLFDFGRARELVQPKVGLDQKELDQCFGAPRYMAPEIALGTSCFCSSDVYSFAIILWEMVALQRPYELPTIDCFYQRIYRGHERPAVDAVPLQWLRTLLESSWAPDPKKRPSMSKLRMNLELHVSPRKSA